MSKIIVFGDIHGRGCWSDIIAKENPDKVIFLGDYVSSHFNITEESQINNLEGILEYKEINPDTVILLRGNHDLEALGYYWAECNPKTGNVVKDYFSENKDRFLSDTQWVYIEGNTIFSHAGISKTWFNNFAFENVSYLNNCEPSEKFSFIPNRLSDYYGDSITQSCVWIRPQSLIEDALDNYIQVVGHTTVKNICNTKNINSKFPEIWLCDCLPKEYLTIEDEKFIINKYE